MKEKYSKPETEIEEYFPQDVLTASRSDVLPDDNDVPFGS